MRDDAYVQGEHRIAAAKIGAKRRAEKKRLESKQLMKRQLELLMIEEPGDVEMKDEMPGNKPCWTKYAQSMFPDFYR